MKKAPRRMPKCRDSRMMPEGTYRKKDGDGNARVCPPLPESRRLNVDTNLHKNFHFYAR